MSATVGPQSRAQASGGCLKCGELGHWARDCKAPREKWLPRNAPQGAAGPTDGGAGAQTSTAPNEADQTQAPLGAAAAAKQQRKRPKVTFDLLKQSNGLPDVYHNFPILFRQQFRGKGHEVSDLRRLLELYKRWQDRVFPHGEFDHFIFAVEKLSGSNIVKKELQDMRVDLLRAVTKAAQGPEEADLEFEDRTLPDDDLLLALAAAEVEEIPLEVDEDDELIALMAQDVDGTLGPNPEAQAEPPADLPDDDELLALVAEADGFLPAGDGASDGAAQGQLLSQPLAVDDDTLLALIEGTDADEDADNK